MSTSFELDHHKNIEYTKKYFKKPTEEIDHIFLSSEELERIKKLDFTNFKTKKVGSDVYLTKDKMDRARDLFLISANTGLRVSDFNRLKKDNIIIDQVTITRTSGGIKEVIEHNKYQLITNHTGRRSFCTNAYLSGMPAIDIMAISGHTSERVFYNYIKVNDLQRAIKISENKFFS